MYYGNRSAVYIVICFTERQIFYIVMYHEWFSGHLPTCILPLPSRLCCKAAPVVWHACKISIWKTKRRSYSKFAIQRKTFGWGWEAMFTSIWIWFSKDITPSINHQSKARISANNNQHLCQFHRFIIAHRISYGPTMLRAGWLKHTATTQALNNIL